ncbi:MAG: MBL fold metallo-hydrolase [Verrucomicrobia bacterium]|nr:MBL fold metallo-hydrolase [Verrucomicrobiota bacterium]MCG2679077.1 MBL fold metallo-hydrolase [Kiritimatiellia bacterium]MBU4248411.1 MBL fold metallo-hydrolase [Verrucomicrobiota bacterium]MBU4290899.1 MBL fold metallo-hydrolase [Verrucomicrobiota bacterium]MBU4428125.1 MBL fold metallo-hydrolase [Verrucomicrobiota bacterium]
MKVCVLASGSSGNCIYVGTESTHVLVDAGMSGRETRNRLEQIGVKLADIQAVCLTHEHSDHIAGLAVLHSRHGINLYANAGTIEAVRLDAKTNALAWHVFTTGSMFQIGDISLDPFAVSHDAYEPVGFVAASGPVRVGIVTDIGVSTHLVRERLKHCRVVIIESNHDEHLLANARRPWSLKQRIAGRQGHLSNQHAAELIAEIAGSGLSHVFLSHLSADCNLPDLALKTAQTALNRQGYAQVRVQLTFPDRISDVWSSD